MQAEAEIQGVPFRDFFNLSAGCKRLPGYDTPPHVSMLYRAAKHGYMGIKLRVIRAPRLMTCDAWLAEWVEGVDRAKQDALRGAAT